MDILIWLSNKNLDNGNLLSLCGSRFFVFLSILSYFQTSDSIGYFLLTKPSKMIKVVQLLLFSVLFLVVKVSSAQSQRTISGFVTNASFNGESKSLTLKFTVNQAFSEEYHFELYTCSADFFKYLVSIEKMSDTKDNPFSEPVLIHSNINNGLGIFGGLSKSVVIM